MHALGGRGQAGDGGQRFAAVRVEHLQRAVHCVGAQKAAGIAARGGQVAAAAALPPGRGGSPAVFVVNTVAPGAGVRVQAAHLHAFISDVRRALPLELVLKQVEAAAADKDRGIDVRRQLGTCAAAAVDRIEGAGVVAGIGRVVCQPHGHIEAAVVGRPHLQRARFAVVQRGKFDQTAAAAAVGAADIDVRDGRAFMLRLPGGQFGVGCGVAAVEQAAGRIAEEHLAAVGRDLPHPHRDAPPGFAARRIMRAAGQRAQRLYGGGRIVIGRRNGVGVVLL